MGCARVRLVSPHPHKSKQRHMVSRASVCQEGAGRLWRSHPRACPGPAQSPGSPQQDTGSPQTDSLEPGTAPTPPSSLRHIPVGMEPAPRVPSLPVAWSTGEGPRLLRDGAAGSRCPPCLCPSPPQVPSQGEAALVSRLQMVGGWRRALFPWQLCWSGALLGAHRTGHCSPQIWAVLSQGPRGAAGCWAPPPTPGRVAGTVWASEGRRESSRPCGLTDGSSGISGGVDRGQGGAGMRQGPRAGGPRPEAGQRVGRALDLRGRSGEGQREPPSPHPTPSYSLLEARTLCQDDTPFPKGPSDGLPSGSFRNLPGDHLVQGEASRSLPHQQPASPLPVGTPASPPHRQQHLPPFQAAASAPYPHPHLTPPVQQPLKYRLNLAHTCLNLLEFLLAP